jgi:prolyl-tRNA synthetase
MNYSDLPGKISHRDKEKASPYAGNDLLISAGFIRPSGKGFVSFLPLGMRVLNNLKRIITEEMEELGGMEITTPLISPESLWETTGRNRSETMEIARFIDRQGKSMILSPTHEEAVTALVKEEIKSHKDLPLFVYQNQLKYRDEIRPRGYLIRSREFLMHDGYSFHRNFTELNNFFPRMFAAYERILKRCAVPYISSEADTGFMHGSRSYEFTLPHRGGKNIIMSCPKCGYRANRSIARCEKTTSSRPLKPLEAVSSALCSQTDEGWERKGMGFGRCKVYRSERRFIMAIYRGDFTLSTEKLKNVAQAEELIPASDDELSQMGIDPESLSPFNLNSSCLIVVDDSVVDTSNLTMASGAKGFCFANVNFGRDFDAHRIGDIVKAGESDHCRICGEKLEMIRGVELAHIFKLDDYYSKKMGLSFQDEDNKVKIPFMGSYGIGLGRLLFAVAEANRDSKGLKWPEELAPFRYYIMGIGKSPTIKSRVYSLAEKLGKYALVDDRKEGIGVKLRDCDMLGIPCRIIVSNRYLEREEVELYKREDGSLKYVPYNDLLTQLEEWEREQGLTL